MPSWTGRAEPGADKYIKNKFSLEVDGIPLMDFDKVDIPEQVWNLVEHRESTGPLKKNTTKSTLQPMDITFTKDLRKGNEPDLDDFEDWFKNKLGDKRGGTFTAYDKEDNAIRTWNFFDGMLIKFKRPDFESDSDDPVQFVMTLRVSDIERV